MRPARALIDLSALRHNYRLAREARGAGARGGQGQRLRTRRAALRAGAGTTRPTASRWPSSRRRWSCARLASRQPILLLEGFFDVDGARLSRRAPAVVRGPPRGAAAQAIERTPLARPLDVWLKLDCGMHRVGFVRRRGGAHGPPAGQRQGRDDRADEPLRPRRRARLPAQRWSSCARSKPPRAGLPGERQPGATPPAILGWPQARQRLGAPRHHALRRRARCQGRRAAACEPVMTLEIADHRRARAARRRAGGLRRTLRRRAPDPRRRGGHGLRRRLPARGAATARRWRSMVVPPPDRPGVDGHAHRRPHRPARRRPRQPGRAVGRSGAGQPRWPQAAGTIAYELLCNVKRVGVEYVRR